MPHDINNNRISELFIGPRIRHRNPERIRESHQPGAFARRQAARVPAFALMNEDFRTVLVVTRGQGARDAVGVDQPEAEAVAGSLVLGGVALQVGPELVGEDVFRVDLPGGMVEEAVAIPHEMRLRAVGAVQDVLHRVHALRRQRQGVPVEGDLIGLAEADDQDALAVLRNEVRAIDDARVDVVAEVVERALDHVEGAPLVVRHQVLDVLQQEGARLFGFDDAADVEEERALRFVGEAVRAAEGVLFGDAGNRERLAGEAGEQQVVIGNVGGVDLRDVAVDGVSIRKILGVGFLRVRVPFAGEDATPSNILEGGSDPANPGKGKAQILGIRLSRKNRLVVGGHYVQQ